MQTKEEEPPQKRTVRLGKLFIQEFPTYSKAMQNAINDVRNTFMDHGLEKSKYKGKIRNSWTGTKIAANKAFTKANNLRHIHLGVPDFSLSPNGKYYTSDYVLHFQYDPSTPNDIRFIKATPHYSTNPKRFNLPTEHCLQ
jgi:hypothetical protein